MSIRHSAAAAKRRGLPPGTDHLRYFGYDDEPLTPQELAAIEEGERAAARGDVVPLEEVLRELGYRSRPARKKDAGARAGTRPEAARKSAARHAR